MIDAQIRRIDLERRTVVVATEDGREFTLDIHEDTNVEVREPTTLGTMGGSLADLREGYWVQVAFEEQAGGHCHCSSLVSIS